MLRIMRRFLSGLAPVLVLHAVLANAAATKEAVWQTSFQAAQAKAKAQKKILLVAFTGSDWCPWCKKLKAEVFDKQPFASAAHKRFVLVQIDFPHEKKLPNELKEQNGKLAKKYKINTFPSVLLLKPDGELIAHTGYSPGGAENYNKKLAGLMKTYGSLAELRTQLPTATGLDRAKLLDQLIEAYNKLGNEIGDIAGWRKEIVALDSDNKAGLKRKYEFRMYVDGAQKALSAAKPAVAEAAIDKALALSDLNPQQIQRATIVKSNCCLAREDYQASLDCLRKALDAAPKGQNADTLKALIRRSEKLLEAQRAKKADGKARPQANLAGKGDSFTAPAGWPSG
ncbi:MAG: thioredoxin family protein [Thermoguttaceae bacterium]